MSRQPIRRLVPDDFVEMKPQFSSIRQMTKHWRASEKTIRRWIEESGVPHERCINSPILRPVPDDFAEKCPTMTKAQMLIYYQTSGNVLNRWIAESGVQPKAHKRGYFKMPRTGGQPIPPPKRENQYDLAADYLRRFMPVSSCDRYGKWRLNGSHYRVGNTLMTPDEMMAKSEAKKEREIRKIFRSANIGVHA